MASIPLDQFDSVAAAVAEYRGLLKVQDAIINGDITLTVKFNSNVYNLVGMFGEDAVRQTLVPGINSVVAQKAEALAALSIIV